MKSTKVKLAREVSDIPLTKAVMGDAELQAVRRVIESKALVQGREVDAFEKEFARLVKAPHACAVSSGTTALHLALKAVGVKEGDEVITVSYSFIATASSVRHAGAVPVFVDVDPKTGNMDPKALERAITRRTKAVLCVHQLGVPCDLSSILSIAKSKKIPVIEDAACALGSEILRGSHFEKIGKPHSDIACFSFHPRKVLTTGDGGMLTTLNPDYDSRFRLWRQHGMFVSDLDRKKLGGLIDEGYTELGYNYRLSELQAAVGRAQLGRLPAILEKRRELASHYLEIAKHVEGIFLPDVTKRAKLNWQSFSVRLSPHIDRRQLREYLLSQGIQTRRGVMCSHRELAFQIEPWKCEATAKGKSCPRNACPHLRQSEYLSDHELVLPLHPGLNFFQIERIVEALKAGRNFGRR